MARKSSALVTNRRAGRDYEIVDTLEAGLVLTGTEVKSIRAGHANLTDSYCRVDDHEVFMIDAHISKYSHGNLHNHEPLRPRKLLLHGREIARLKKATEQKGFTVVPLRLYLRRGLIKAQIGIARGKRQYDKRSDIAARDAQRNLDRVMKQYRS
ncbi:MAG: SsrA-binding protein SmpB [Bacteroidota bacterium]|nr:SsrA-binding protein SmpB [Bacteroidota bacterium]MDE2834923.1 SsrA-binding protein SmpB [Bacteroidota bacterium]MDE2956964.1 SsrA-binding protein SmpB [Bacteroidota bacterium]